MNKIAELRQKRASLIEEVRKIQEAASGGILSADQLGKVAGIEADISNLEKNAELQERQDKREAELAVTGGKNISGGYTSDDRAKKDRADAEVRGIVNFLVSGERRDLSADTAVQGGNIIVPQQLHNELIQKLRDAVWVRQYAKVIQLGSAQTLGVPNVSANMANAEWTTEIQAVTNDTALQFGKRAMTPTMLTKGIKVSIKLLEILSVINPTGELSQQLADACAAAEENAFMTGDGSGKPLGLFTASANGISTGRDVSTGSATAITADSLFDVVSSIKRQYRKGAKWVLHRDIIKQIRKLKTTTNDYLFQPGLTLDRPDTLLGYEILESEFAPSTLTTGQYVGLFGDLSKYWIADQLGASIQRLNELYANTNQVGFIIRKNTDGAPVDELAFARMKTN